MSSKRNGTDEDLPAVVESPAEVEASAAAPGDEAGLAEAEAPPADPLDAMRRERDELRDVLLRRRAEFENYRRRVERDRGTAATEAEAALLRQLLGTVDNLERALAAGGEDSALRAGVELTLRELQALFESLGVGALHPLGRTFDPAHHQAIVHEPAAGFEAGTVAEVYRKGYTYKERLLRPALVKVASAARDGHDDGGDVQ